MSHPKWNEVYYKNLTLTEFINHIYSHRIFLNAIFKENVKKILEIGIGSGSMSMERTPLALDTGICYTLGLERKQNES